MFITKNEFEENAIKGESAIRLIMAKKGGKYFIPGTILKQMFLELKENKTADLLDHHLLWDDANCFFYLNIRLISNNGEVIELVPDFVKKEESFGYIAMEEIFQELQKKQIPVVDGIDFYFERNNFEFEVKITEKKD